MDGVLGCRKTPSLRVPTAPQLEDAGMLSWFKVYEDPVPWFTLGLCFSMKKGVYV